MTTCALALEDGTIFRGTAFGGTGTRTGEVVFNTAMTGYQEVLTDPSYAGQVVVMTSPHIGNYGVNDHDVESGGLHLAGLVVREVARRYSNPRATASLADYLAASGVIGLTAVDTRALTRHLRCAGAMRAALSTDISDAARLIDVARGSAPMDGRELVSTVAGIDPQTCHEPQRSIEVPRSASLSRASAAPAGRATRRVVLLDCGAKRSILRRLEAAGCEVILARFDAPAEAILEHRPGGVVISNGPGDPAAVAGTIHTVRQLIGRVPMFGICLGCQLLGLALGARTYKMKFGHHGVNHPVLDLASGRVEITSQNHGFAVDEASLGQAGAKVTRINLYDRTVEGFTHPDHRLMAIQYHPEAGPGPLDGVHLFGEFANWIGGAPSGPTSRQGQPWQQAASGAL